MEEQSVRRETRRASVGERGARGNIRIQRDRIESRDPTGGADGIAIQPPRRAAAHEHEVLQVAGVGIEAAEITRPDRLAARRAHGTIVRRSWRVRPPHMIGQRHVANRRREGVNQRHDLIRLEQQVAQLAHDVAILLLHLGILSRIAAGCAGREDAVEEHVLAVVPGRAPGVRAVVRQLHHPAVEVIRRAVDRLEIPRAVLVRTRPGVVVANRLGDGEVAIPVGVVRVRIQPVRSLEAGQVVLDVEEVGRVRRRERRLIAQLVEAEHVVVHELVNITARQIMRVEEVHVVFLLRPVQAPEVAGIRIRTRLACATDDAEMEMQRARRGHADFVPDEIVHDFIQRPCHGTAIPLPFASGQLAPFRREAISVLVLRVEQSTVLEPDAEAALAGMITSVRAAQTVADVVIHLAVVNHRSLPVEMEPPLVASPAHVLRQLIVRAEPRTALIHVR